MAVRSSGVVKSRHGCRRCKTRRIKCDEAVPACTNCLQRGWQCPGYGPNIRWSTKHERFGALSRASDDGGPPMQQTSQQLHYDNDYSVVQDETGIPFGTSNLILDNNLDTESVSALQPHLPITPSSQYTCDEPFGLHEDLPCKSVLYISSPTYGMGDYYRHDLLETQSSANNERALNGLPASSSFKNVSPYMGVCESPFDPRMFYTPTHIPTILIEHWFSDVCPMWNIFDSDSNFNRQFASASWSSSEPVFFAMQSMSAACLVDTLPAMMPVLRNLTSKALAAIDQRVFCYKDLHCTMVPTFPTDLLFAIFAMGTSLHWKHGFELGGSLLKYAHCVIDCYRKRLPSMGPTEREHLAFFQKAMICWEGILSAADRNFTPASFIIRRKSYQARIKSGQNEIMSPQRTFGPRVLSVSDAELHPWCGVSSDVLQTFGQVMTLCHLAQDTKVMAVEESHIDKHYEIGLAHELASELVSMDFTQRAFSDIRFPRTNDTDTPLSHLIDIAEAYRQTCFLQLCLTFEDLQIDATAYSNIGLTLPQCGDNGTAQGMTRSQRLVSLSLQLVERLKRIPPESGSRCMQPLLYLCAASGLQLNPLPPFQALSPQSPTSDFNDSNISNDASREPGNFAQSEHSHEIFHPEYMRAAIASRVACAGTVDTNHMLTVSAFKVAQARSFVKKRLGMLQQLLPPRYTNTALKLAEAIWAEYDCASNGGTPLYWFDVMVREKLQTFFG